jgi:hypothetical protein
MAGHDVEPDSGGECPAAVRSAVTETEAKVRMIQREARTEIDRYPR